MGKLFPSGPVLELDNVQCCNQVVESDSSSDSDNGVIYSGQLHAVVKKILELWRVDTPVDIHVRHRSYKNIEAQ